MTVGAVITETGIQAPLAAGYRKGLVLWQEQVNAAGGILGRRVELRLRDDGSQAARSRALYGDLIRDKTDLLVGPYGSAATLIALGEAERAKRVMVNGAGPSKVVHKRAPRYVFQVAAPYEAYAAGIVELARAAGCTSLFVTSRDDLSSAEMAEGAAALARAGGLAVSGPEIYTGGTVDFVPLVERARDSGNAMWLAFGEARDVAEILRTSAERKYAPRAFASDAVTRPRFLPLVGQWAERALGVVEYDARLATPSNGEFVKAYNARWSAPPDAAAAQGYAAGTVLAAAVRRAGTLDQAKLRAALAGIEVDTVLGRYRVDPATGVQTGIRPAIAQVVNGRREIVWPAAIRTAEANLPCR